MLQGRWRNDKDKLECLVRIQHCRKQARRKEGGRKEEGEGRKEEGKEQGRRKEE